MGYKPQTITSSSKKHLIIVLEEDGNSLDEVMVMGYGTAKKRRYAGSSSTNDVLENEVQEVAVADEGSKESTKTLIRGIGSVNHKNNPLFIVDGEIYEGDISEINASEIQSTYVMTALEAGELYGEQIGRAHV